MPIFLIIVAITLKLCYNRIMKTQEILTRLRKENNLSQQRLAEGLGVGQATICQWESGASMPSYDMIIKLAQFYNVSADFLLGLSDEYGKSLTIYKNVSDSESALLNMYGLLSGRQKEIIMRLLVELAGQAN